MKNFSIRGVHWKMLFLGGFTKTQYIGGELSTKGGLVQFAGLRRDMAKRRGWCFFRGVDIPMHTMGRKIMQVPGKGSYLCGNKPSPFNCCFPLLSTCLWSCKSAIMENKNVQIVLSQMPKEFISPMSKGL